MLIFFEKVKLLDKNLEPVTLMESEYLYILRLKFFLILSQISLCQSLSEAKFTSLITVALQGIQRFE